MDNKDPDIISKQTSAIAVLCAIILVLAACLFFLGYCEPRHEKMNESPAASSGQSSQSSGDEASGTSSASQTGDSEKKDTAQSK